MLIPAPLDQLLRSQQEKIAKYKWIESEKTGRDIGWQRASVEWVARHVEHWIGSHCQAIDRALSANRF
jgi:hypothetical protein